MSLAALAALALVLGATSPGLALSPDSLAYALLARSLLRHEGFRLMGEVATHFPPAYPALLALVGAVDPSTLMRATVVQAGLFALNVVLLARVVARASGRRGAGAAAAALMVASPAMMVMHATLWSEALFLAWTLAAMWLCDVSCERGRGLVAPALTGLCLAAAILTRYAGLALVAPVLYILLRRRPGTAAARAAAVAITGASALLPPALWVLRNVRQGGSATDRVVAFHPLGLGNIEQLFAAFAELGGFGTSRTAGGIVLAIGLGLALWRGSASLAATLAGAYAALLALSLTLFDADTPLDTRIVAPLYLFLMIAAMATIARSAAAARPASRVLLPAGVALLVSCGAVRTSSLARRWHDTGQGFAHAYWSESPTLAYARALPAGTRVYTNLPELVAFATGVESRDVPETHARTSLRARPEYEAERAAMCRETWSRGAVVLHFDGVSWRWQAPSGAAIADACGLAPVARFRDGAAYGVIDPSRRLEIAATRP